MKFFYVFIFVCVSIVLLASGCLEEKKEQATEKTAKEKAISLCITLCKNYNMDLSKGPCLSENILDGWVCDVAHNPREEVDNNPENQCLAYREGKASHFVEVDPKCTLIRAI